MAQTILLVGYLFFDIAAVVDVYPQEDSEKEAKSLDFRRGGNASNSATAMSHLLRWAVNNGQLASPDDVKIELLASNADDLPASFMISDLQKHGILCPNLVRHPNTTSNVCYILITESNGNRTMVFSRAALPPLTINDFKKLKVENYAWIHFELRGSLTDLREMIRFARRSTAGRSAKQVISAELEAPNEELDIFWAEDIDIYFLSKDYAKSKGCSSLEAALELLPVKIPYKAERETPFSVIFGWGEVGAGAFTIDPKIKSVTKFTSKAFSPKGPVVDTVAAGDSFIAAVIFGMSVLQMNAEDALRFGCRFAGAKVGLLGIPSALDKFDQLIDD